MNDEILKNSIPLSSAIRLVQDELIKSEKERKEQGLDPLFKVDKLIIEANCIFTKKENSELGFDVKLLSLFSAKANTKIDEENGFIQKITLELKVIDDKEASDNTSNGEYPYHGLR